MMLRLLRKPYFVFVYSVDRVLDAGHRLSRHVYSSIRSGIVYLGTFLVGGIAVFLPRTVETR